MECCLPSSLRGWRGWPVPERFSPVPGENVVFRLVDENSTFLPAGAQLPLPAWFNPSTTDIDEGKARGRQPGFSVWNQAVASVEQVKVLVTRPDSLAFGLEAAAVREVGKAHQRALEVLADPADSLKPGAGWDAHTVIEGLQRPEGLARPAQKDLQSALAAQCRRL